ncbi:hypothetical protein J7T55_014987 [Diaporthe amygdali]|uniref:uncharacterized protein n=1 Tax=Phomopsis amygdali TaxID=1214568 RepID=UPI0022FDDB94|nr:uncharacterized protein J7T55_014987 [Diaporthe amygdali]KAJ0106911.1 hypothetical protein J7T55_014987 [Diaporthe amygdali]
MGGNAFKWHYTPRMPKRVYRHVLEQVTANLRTKFGVVIVPPGVPGKTDHGDLDVIVGKPFEGKLLTKQDLAGLIGAIDINDADREWVYYAISWPGEFAADLPTRPVNFDDTRWDRTSDGPQDMDVIQVDVQQYKDPMVAEWNAYWISYGCMRPIMKAILRDHGLRHQLRPEHNYDGLILRPHDIEEAVEQGYLMVKGGKKWCDIPLSLDPTELLRFAGMLSIDQKWSDLKFENAEQMSALICAKNHFFDPDKLQLYVSQYEEEYRKYREQEPAEKYLSMFKYLVKDYVPSHQESLKPGLLARLSPSEVQKEVRSFFSYRAQEIEIKVKSAKSLYEPKRFWVNLTSQLRLEIQPEVVSDVNIRRYGKIGTLLWFASTGLKSLLLRNPSLLEALVMTPLSADDNARLKGLVNTRISYVVRRIKSKTVNYDASKLLGMNTATVLEYDLWEAGDYDKLLNLCVGNREVLEQEQKDIDVKNYLDSLERRGKLKTPRDVD